MILLARAISNCFWSILFWFDPSFLRLHQWIAKYFNCCD